MTEKSKQLVMGNEAIGRGLIESGCQVASAYPGTPSTEILQSVVAMKDAAVNPMHVEWSVNEKIAFEVALAASYTGKRSVAVMKQVGLNVAADPFMRTAYLGVRGGMLTIVADDPGPHSSQNEQDTRLFCLQGRVPVLDPSSPAEAKEMIGPAFALSEKYEMNVVLRPTTRVCHSRQSVSFEEPQRLERQSAFEANPGRWCATPAFLPGLHRKLNENLAKVAVEPDWEPRFVEGDNSYAGTALVASGIAYANLTDLLEELGLADKLDVFQVLMPYPLNPEFIDALNSRYQRVLILEETYPVIELQLAHRGAAGKQTGDVPREGELTPDVLHRVLADFLGLPQPGELLPEQRGQRPSLCPGCPHRAAFYTIKKCFPDGIFPSDIGCYTLGMNLGAVHTVHCMGACISQGAGFYQAYKLDGADMPTVVVSIGDSTFFHAGIPALINAVLQGARIIVTILDNSTTAMTGGQPVPHQGVTACGEKTRAIEIESLVRAAGVQFVKSCDPYESEKLERIFKEADDYIRSEDGGVAVVISRRPCVMDPVARKNRKPAKVRVTDECLGCGMCVEELECPALSLDSENDVAVVDEDRCIGCGTCIRMCPAQAIIMKEM